MSLKEKMLKKPLPNHIAIILDGNGRWAKKRGLVRSLGHRAGAINLKDIALECNSLGIKVLTVYAFSTENWNRPKDEVDYLMSTPVKAYNKYKNQIEESNIKITFIGRRDRFPKDFLECVIDCEESTKNNTGLHLVICADYGSRYELTETTKKIADMVNRGKIGINDITPELIDSMVFTNDLPPLDLLIRTSGEIRISNFLLWQLAYAEMYFTDVYWPAFNNKELYKAIISFQKRDRRFGAIKEKK